MSSYLIIDTICLYAVFFLFRFVFCCYITCMNGTLVILITTETQFFELSLKNKRTNTHTHISGFVCVCLCTHFMWNDTGKRIFSAGLPRIPSEFIRMMIMIYTNKKVCIVFYAYALEREGGNSEFILFKTKLFIQSECAFQTRNIKIART